MTPTHIAVDDLVRPLVAKAVGLYQEVLDAERDATPGRSSPVAMAHARLDGACEVLARMWQLLGMDPAQMDAATARRVVAAEHENPSPPPARAAVPAPEPVPAPAPPASEPDESLVASIARKIKPTRYGDDSWGFELRGHMFYVLYRPRLGPENAWVVSGPRTGREISREASLEAAVVAAVRYDLAWGAAQHSKLLRQAVWLDTLEQIGHAMAGIGKPE